MKKGRGRPRSNKKESKAYDIEEILNGEPFQLELVTTKVGGMKAAFRNHFYEFHFNRNGNKFWRCLSHTSGCQAKIMSRGNTLFIINIEHNHQPNPIQLVDTAIIVPIEKREIDTKVPVIAKTVTVMPVGEELKQRMKDRLAAIGRKLKK